MPIDQCDILVEVREGLVYQDGGGVYMVGWDALEEHRDLGRCEGVSINEFGEIIEIDLSDSNLQGESKWRTCRICLSVRLTRAVKPICSISPQYCCSISCPSSHWRLSVSACARRIACHNWESAGAHSPGCRGQSLERYVPSRTSTATNTYCSPPRVDRTTIEPQSAQLHGMQTHWYVPTTTSAATNTHSAQTRLDSSRAPSSSTCRAMPCKVIAPSRTSATFDIGFVCSAARFHRQFTEFDEAPCELQCSAR
jgi:hypothetical protein